MIENTEFPSEIISPFDEQDDMTQEELNEKNLMDYDKKQVLDAVGEKKSKVAFDLYFDDCIESLEGDEKREFIAECLSKLVSAYSLSFIEDYVQRNNMLVTKLDMIINLIKYICQDEWLMTLLPQFEKIPLEIIFNSEALRDFITVRIPSFRAKIKGNEQINKLIRYFIINSPTEDSLAFLFKLINKDIVGVVSTQIVMK